MTAALYQSFAKHCRRVLDAKGMLEKDMQLGRIRDDVDTDLVVDIIYTLNLHLLVRYFQEDNKEALTKMWARS